MARVLAALVIAVLGLVAGPSLQAPGGAVVAAPVYAPVDQPGPALSVPEAVLAQSLQCTANATAADREVVLFVPGTTVTPKEDFGWNWFPALSLLGWPYCSVTLPNHAMTDTQVSAEYVVYAIRHVHRISGRRVDVLGHSQGGTEPRFALRFWPDLRPMVDDYITFAATNHGSVAVNLMCATTCAESLWQQTYHSRYTEAMNSYQETFPGISYTDIYTHHDQFVQPNLDDTGTTSLHGGGGSVTNVAVQDVCPADLAEHIAVGTYDPVAYAIAMDALTHDGPAVPGRVSHAVCTEAFMPGVNSTQFPGAYADALDTIVSALLSHPTVAAEPPLKSYTLAH
jgi:triacylglycerol esterase/lipase EstA (alpha/beta hydrolase family)